VKFERVIASWFIPVGYLLIICTEKLDTTPARHDEARSGRAFVSNVMPRRIATLSNPEAVQGGASSAPMMH